MSLRSTQGGLITANPPAPAGPSPGGTASGVWTLQQAAYWLEEELWPSRTPAIGKAFGGGFFAGQIGVNGVATHNLVVGPLSTAEFTGRWKTSNTSTAGTTSVINGPANTAAMMAAGVVAHPCGQFCNNLVLGGFSDWYMPAQNELEVCYFNLKPTTSANSTSSGINANAVPARASNYTSGTPAQTSAANFITSTGAEAFAADRYWSSTEGSATGARDRSFSNGGPLTLPKGSSYRVRAIRRLAV